MKHEFTAIFERDGDWHIGVPDDAERETVTLE